MNKSRTIKVALLQHACSRDRDATVATTTAMVREAHAQGAKLVVTQELFSSLYFCQSEDAAHFDLAESIPGPTSERFCALARELKIALSISLFEKRAPGLYHNTSLMIGPDGQIIDRYRKMHIPDDPRFYEKFYFTPGDLGFRAQQLPWCKTGMLVCWDQWYPEAARETALRGAELLLYPTAIGWYHTKDGGGETPADRKQQKEAWQTIQRSHAIANGVFVLVPNRIGVEGDLLFWGSSFIADPGGVVIAEAKGDEQCVLVADLDLERIENIRQGWPFFRDRRIDAYHGVLARYLDNP